MADDGFTIKVESGKLRTTDGKDVAVEKGSFIPHPQDKTLAKKITNKNAEIKILKVRVMSVEKEMAIINKHWVEKNKAQHDYWNDRYRAVKFELDMKNAFWSKYGVTILSCVLVGVASSAITYGVMELRK